MKARDKLLPGEELIHPAQTERAGFVTCARCLRSWRNGQKRLPRCMPLAPIAHGHWREK